MIAGPPSSVVEKPRSGRRVIGLRIGAVVLAGLVIFVSLMPAGLRPDTHISNRIEHFVAYLVMAGAWGVSFGVSPARGLLLIALSGVLEALQAFVPGRSARLFDFAASASGVIAGLSATAMLGLGGIILPGARPDKPAEDAAAPASDRPAVPTWAAAPRACERCRAKALRYRAWPSGAGEWDDLEFECTACGDVQWIDGSET